MLADPSGVTFIDSRGLSELIAGRTAADATAKHFRAIGAAGRVADMMAITGIAEFLAG